MHLTALTLRDFGKEVFRDARMNSIDDGLVVVGGPQRAGKTTLLGALRRLGYGIEQNPELPPPADEHNVRATLQYDGHEYVLKVKGHGDPSLISTGQGPDLDIDDIYGTVSRRQYRQLFTLTLDELKRLPDTVDDSETLSEVLLGAAYGEVSVIPELEETFESRAYDIGRSYGKPTAQSELRAPMNTIEEGISKRDDALDQIDEWESAREDLADVKTRLTELEAQIEELTQKQERLSVLADEFSELRKFQALRSELDEVETKLAKAMPENAPGRLDSLIDSFETNIERRDEILSELSTRSTDSDGEAYKNRLLTSKQSIEACARQISKWETEAERLQSNESELEDRREQLERQIRELYADWSKDVGHIEEIRTDSVSEARVESAVDQYRRASEDLEQANSDLQQAESRLEAHQKQLEGESESPESRSLHLRLLLRGGIVGGASLAIGIGTSLAGNPIAGGIIGTLAFIAGLYFVIRRTVPQATEVDTRRELKNQVQAAEADLRQASDRKDDAKERREEATEALSDIKTELGIPSDVQPESTLDFYSEVRDCRSELREIRAEETNLQEDRRVLETTLNDAADEIAAVRDFMWNEDSPLAHIEHLSDAINAADRDIENAESLEAVQETLSEHTDDFVEICENWDGVEGIDPAERSFSDVMRRLHEVSDTAARCAEICSDIEARESLKHDLVNKLQTGSTKEAYAEIKDANEGWLDALERLGDSFEGEDAVQEELLNTENQLEEANDELEGKYDEKAELENRIADLKSDEDIVDARRKINEGREKLSSLGEDYAVNRIAEDLTKRLHEQFIEEVAGPLIDEAGEIFQQITQEYEGITHNDQFDDLDFEAIRDGKPPHQSDELSRATAEQLFLAIRLARIRQLDVSLPVVIDDAITNFDPAHGARTLQLIRELADTHQVFLLTCHPENVMLAESYGGADQYWCLEDGRFTGPLDASDEVYDLLHTTSKTTPVTTTD